MTMTPFILARVFYYALRELFTSQNQFKRQALATLKQKMGETLGKVFFDEKELRREAMTVRLSALLTLFWTFLLPAALTLRLILSRWWLGRHRGLAEVTIWHVVVALIPFYFMMILGLAFNGWLQVRLGLWKIAKGPVAGEVPQEPPD